VRVLMVSSSFFPEVDGAVRVVYDLSRKLVERGHEVYLLTRWFSGASTFEVFDGIKVMRVGPSRTSTMNRVLLFLNQMLKLVKILSHRKFDVIHSHGCVPALVGLVGKLLRGVPLIVTFHGHQILWPESLRWKGTVTLKLQLWLENLVLRKADVLVAQSLRIRNLFVKLYGARMCRKIQIIPNGVDLDRFKSKACGKVELEKSSPLIFSVGTLSRRKGFDVLIKSMEKVLQKEPNVKLIIAGEGPLGTQLKMLAKKLSVKGHVIFTGRIRDEKLHEYYGMADVIVLPTHAEFFPLIPLEAMAMAKPVISTKVIGPSQIIENGKNGLLVEPNNPEKLAKAISSLISNRTLAKKMGLYGREIVEKKYSLKKIVGLHEKLYQSVSKNRG